MADMPFESDNGKKEVKKSFTFATYNSVLNEAAKLDWSDHHKMDDLKFLKHLETSCGITINSAQWNRIKSLALDVNDPRLP